MMRKAFTLIEILVVVSIIALLMAILLPALLKSRAHARHKVCLSNLREFGSAIAEYSSQNFDVIPGQSGPDSIGWSWIVAKQFQYSSQGIRDVPVDRLKVFQCQERESSQPVPFLDYVHNTMHPDAPNIRGDWEKNDRNEEFDRDWIRIGNWYKQPSNIIFIADAECEDRVFQNKTQGGAYPTVWAARDEWYENRNYGIDVMDVRHGAHLPQGKNNINVSDAPDVRRVARQMHLKRFTNVVFYDRHAKGIELAEYYFPDGKKNDSANFAFWLRRYGIKNADRKASNVTLTR